MYLHHCIIPAYIQNAPFRCFWTYWAMLFVRSSIFEGSDGEILSDVGRSSPQNPAKHGCEVGKNKNLFMSWQSCCCFTRFVVLDGFGMVWPCLTNYGHTHCLGCFDDRKSVVKKKRWKAPLHVLISGFGNFLFFSGSNAFCLSQIRPYDPWKLPIPVYPNRKIDRWGLANQRVPRPDV